MLLACDAWTARQPVHGRVAGDSFEHCLEPASSSESDANASLVDDGEVLDLPMPQGTLDGLQSGLWGQKRLVRQFDNDVCSFEAFGDQFVGDFRV